MTPERKKYLANISEQERDVREHIGKLKQLIKTHKMLLNYGSDVVTQVYIKKKSCVIPSNGTLIMCKNMLFILKKQLPQRWPKEKLKPCPFCGSDKKLHTMALGEKEGEEIHIISCCKCDFQIKKTSEKDLFETWNKRRSDE